MTREEYLNQRNALLTRAQSAVNSGNFEEYNRIRTEIEQLDDTYEQTATAQANLNALANPNNQMLNMDAFSRGNINGNVFSSGNIGIQPEDTYEHAFMNFVCRGTPVPGKYLNLAESTTTSTAPAPIPKTLLKEIIRELKAYGGIYNKVRMLNIQGGVEVPILSVLPTATWVGESASESQKLASTEKVTFSYYGLECKLSQSILSNVVSVEEFNALFVPLCVEAIITALEKAIISGDGSSKPLGIVKDTRISSTNVITLSPEDMASWAAWKKKVFGKMKKAYRNGEFIMAQGTFDGYIDGMVDSNGQPIGRVNYGIENGESYRFGGKVVETVEDDLLTSYDSASTGDVIAIFADLKNYAINTNMQMTTTKWTDNDANEVKTKVMLICDGKLLDPNGVLIIKKGASSAS